MLELIPLSGIWELEHFKMLPLKASLIDSKSQGD